MVKVLASMMTRGGTRALTMAATVASSAAGLGGVGVMGPTSPVGVFGSAAVSTPAPALGRGAAALVPEPQTARPAARRLRANAPPMMPRPTIPTLPFAIASLRCRSIGRRTLHGGGCRVQAQYGRAAQREGSAFLDRA